jgi:hypothetical protein
MALMSHIRLQPAALGLILVFLAAVLFCGHFQVLGNLNLAGGLGIECSQTLFLVSSAFLKGHIGFFGLLLMSFVTLIAFIIQRRGQLSEGFLKISQIISKLFNPLLEALRRGILHPQIYNILKLVISYRLFCAN